jgi:ABC-2 type transport system ATP-binding protein
METIVYTNNLTKVYKKQMEAYKTIAVDSLSIQINKGCVFGLLGPNGSGKTTTMKLLLGILKPTKGEVLIFNKKPDLIETKNLVGYMPENPCFYEFLRPDEILNHYAMLFCMPHKETKSRIDSLLKLVGLEEYREKKLQQFSKGMLQRLGIAQALLNDPELLILDEPTIGLDPLGIKDVKDLILDLKSKGKTIILSSHILSDVEGVCDKIVILYKGKNIAEGPIKDLLSKKGQTEIIVDNIDDKTIKQVAQGIEQTGGKIVSMGHPTTSLEEFFVKTIGEHSEKYL